MPDAPTDQISLLRLHTDSNGIVWAGDDVQLAINTACSAPAFFNSDVLNTPWSKVRSVRLLGIRENAALICHIHQRRAAEPQLLTSQRVYLFSPVIQADAKDPVAILQTLWQPSATSVLSNQMHLMTPQDFCTYGLILETFKAGGQVSDVIRRIIRYHPAWPALSFVRSLNIDHACALLNEIVDPRWFLHPKRPHRLTRLYAYLGLTQKNILAVIRGGDPDRNYNRALLAVRSWYDPQAVGSYTEDFLWRTCSAGTDQIRGVLRATQRFISFVATYWLTTMNHAHPEAGFRPDLFFHADDEIAAFHKHLTTNRVSH